MFDSASSLTAELKLDRLQFSPHLKTQWRKYWWWKIHFFKNLYL